MVKIKEEDGASDAASSDLSDTDEEQEDFYRKRAFASSTFD